MKVERNGENVQQIKERVAQACRVLGVFDITPSIFGHASARIPGTDRILIRARGHEESGVRYTSDLDVIEIDLDGRRIGGADDGYSAPLEVHIHTQLYRRRPDVFGVVHAHPSAAVLMTICDRPLLPIYGSYDPFGLALALNGIPTFDRSILIREPNLGSQLATAMEGSQVCLMRGHGITTVANSVEEAALLAIQLNTLAEMNYRASAIGNVRSISSEDQEVFRQFEIESGNKQRQPIAGLPSRRIASMWRYYARYANGDLA
jgi:L-fuculose-phosphate aldolase